MSAVKARANVAVIVEFDLTDQWGGETKCDQILKQAKQSAREKLVSLFKGEAILIGDPKIFIILTDADNPPHVGEKEKNNG